MLAGFFQLHLEGALAAVTPVAAAPATQIDEEIKANLRALGYPS